MSWTRNVCALMLAIGAAACARALPPPGGERDTEPPRVLSASPENLAVVPPFRGPVVFQFDETLSERGFNNNLVIVSPEQGTPTVNRDGSELRVRVEGGWQPNRVYRIVVLPGLQDRHNNQRRVPTELVFSTGLPILPTAIAGLVTDRITRRPVPNARVVAIAPDSTLHVTATDTAGFFALRYLPVAQYLVHAYEDRNRNRRMEASEPHFSRNVTLTSPQDTQVAMFELLPTDTLPARLVSAEARDSVQVRLTFDDYLDPSRSLEGVSARVFRLPDSTVVTGFRLMHPHAFEALRAAQAARDTARRVGPPPVPQPDSAPPLPTRELVMLFERPLPPETRFRVFISSLTNISGVEGGGGTAAFVTPARRDTADVRRDTATVRRDRPGIRSDTSAAQRRR